MNWTANKNLSVASMMLVLFTAGCAGPGIEQGYMQPYKKGRGYHIGLDLSGYDGEPVRAAYDGTVVGSGPSLVVIKHPDDRETSYYHIGNVLVSKGQKVTKGQQIAELALNGVSGPHDSSTITRPHLHMELHAASGRGLDPESLDMSCKGPGWWWPVGCSR